MNVAFVVLLDVLACLLSGDEVVMLEKTDWTPTVFVFEGEKSLIGAEVRYVVLVRWVLSSDGVFMS